LSGAVDRHRAAGDGVGCRLAARLADLAEQVRRLDPPGRRDPERFWRDKSDLAAQIAEIGQDAARRLGYD
jgi:hypothetical protein